MLNDYERAKIRLSAIVEYLGNWDLGLLFDISCCSTFLKSLLNWKLNLIGARQPNIYNGSYSLDLDLV
jgi:hypothetical protein